MSGREEFAGFCVEDLHGEECGDAGANFSHEARIWHLLLLLKLN
jgi:hypothetical protein